MKRLTALLVGALLIAGFAHAAHAAEKYLFYTHGCCINKLGSGAYETIAKELKKDGFNVIFELRDDDSNAALQAEVAKVAEQVRSLLAKGTPPEDITVSGYSLGSVVSLFASIAIANPKVNYVLIAGCPGRLARSFDIDYSKVQGHVLSIVDIKDDRFGSCKQRLPESVLQKEVEIDSGYGHPVFRYTDEKNMRLWKEPLEAWAKLK